MGDATRGDKSSEREQDPKVRTKPRDMAYSEKNAKEAAEDCYVGGRNEPLRSDICPDETRLCNLAITMR